MGFMPRDPGQGGAKSIALLPSGIALPGVRWLRVRFPKAVAS